MNMNMDMGSASLPWLDQPVLLHSSRADTCKLTAEQCDYRHGFWRYWYEADHRFALPTIYFGCAIVLFFTVVNIVSKVSTSQRYSANGSQTTVWKRILAMSRYMAYKSFYIKRFRWYSPSAGVMVIGLIGVIFFSVMTLGPSPYYWPNTAKLSYGSSPPIATRAGWMAVALLPFAMITASKANPITLLTGVSHEKLQVFHRWTSWIMFVLALVHTFPFIIYHTWKGDMMTLWMTSVVYWTGAAALIPQAWLTLMSIGFIRNRYYEFFKSTHYLAIIFFVFFFFIHCDFRLSSWDYFIATMSIYIASLGYSIIRVISNSAKARAHLSLHADSTIRISIPTTITWSPGQHVFLRLLALGPHALTTHPFTICSLPRTMPDGSSEMVFYIRPAGGFTARFKSLAERGVSSSGIPVMIDGPYGGVAPLESYQRILLIGGGSGAGLILPILESLLARCSTNTNSQIRDPLVHVILTVQSHASAKWLNDAVKTLLVAAKCRVESVKVDLYVTLSEPICSADAEDLKSGARSQEEGIENETSIDAEKGNASSIASTEDDTSRYLSLHSGAGRPDFKNIIREAIESSDPTTKVAIVSCGPKSMGLDISNSAAEAQRRILKGGPGAENVYLFQESFHW